MTGNSFAPPESARDGAANRTPPGVALTAAVLGFFIITLDSLVVNVALPSIGVEVGGGVSSLQWVVDGYTLMFASFMLSAGSLIDRIGAAQVYRIGLTLFTLASVACGFSTSLGMLVAARLAQGCAASVIMPASLALIRQAYPDRPRVRALAIWTAGGAIAAAAGPVAGGVFTSAFGWRSIFFLNVPVCALALALLAGVARSPRRPSALDLPGQLTGILTLSALTYGVIEGEAHGFSTTGVLTAFAVAAVALAAFLVIENKTAQPMLPLHLLTARLVAVPSVAGATISVAFYGGVFILGLYFQQGRGQTPFAAGLMFLPMTTAVAVLNLFVATRLIHRCGARFTIVLGQAVTAADLLAIAVLGDRIPDAALAVLIIPICFAGGVAVPAATSLLLNNVPVERTGAASAVMNTFRQIGTALAIAVFGGLLANMGGIFTGMRASMITAAVILVGSITVVLSAVRKEQA